jgi:hypothetical protein
MESNVQSLVTRLVEVEAREQLKNLPASFRKYRGNIDFPRLIDNAVDRLPPSFRTLGENYHDRQTRQLRVRIAVERSLVDQLQELKLYYVSRADVEGEDDIPTESLGELYLSR